MDGDLARSTESSPFIEAVDDSINKIVEDYVVACVVEALVAFKLFNSQFAHLPNEGTKFTALQFTSPTFLIQQTSTTFARHLLGA